MNTKRMLEAVALGLFLQLLQLSLSNPVYAGMKLMKSTPNRTGTPSTPKKSNFTFTTIDVPSATKTAANGNSTEAIVGQYDDNAGTHGFVLQNGGFTTIDVPGAVGFSGINGVNAKGDLTGTYQDANKRLHAFFKSGDSFITLDPPGASNSQGGFVNAQDEVVGGYRDSTRRRHAFLWSRKTGVFTTIDPPESLKAKFGPIALGINSPGQIVGTYVDMAGNRHGFLLSDGVYTTLDVPEAGVSTLAEGISNSGKIVGFYFGADGNSHGFILIDGVYTTIDVPNSTSTSLFSINAKGEVVGEYDDAIGSTHGFVGTPTR